jgi:hypothetical protein
MELTSLAGNTTINRIKTNLLASSTDDHHQYWLLKDSESVFAKLANIRCCLDCKKDIICMHREVLNMPVLKWWTPWTVLLGRRPPTQQDQAKPVADGALGSTSHLHWHTTSAIKISVRISRDCSKSILTRGHLASCNYCESSILCIDCILEYSKLTSEENLGSVSTLAQLRIVSDVWTTWEYIRFTIHQIPRHFFSLRPFPRQCRLQNLPVREVN